MKIIKKTIRFIGAVILSPLVFILMFLDWLYECDYDSTENWKRYITFKEIPHKNYE